MPLVEGPGESRTRLGEMTHVEKAFANEFMVGKADSFTPAGPTGYDVCMTEWR